MDLRLDQPSRTGSKGATLSMPEISPASHSFRQSSDSPQETTIAAIGELSGLLLNPVRELLAGPSKKVRSGLLLASAGLSSRDGLDPKIIKQCHDLAEVLENLHAGSLIIDDIQDQAVVRRGLPTLHEQLGVPLAINAGNWLYFKALKLIEKAELAPDFELRLYRLCHDTLFEGHLGQALDVGICIDEIEQSRVPTICYAAMTMKSGALISLAAEAGARAARAPEDLVEAFATFGQSFGCALQMFNDLGEFVRSTSGLNKDLFLRRPSWIWAVASESLAPADYASLAKRLGSIARSEDMMAINEVLREKNLLQEARVRAQEKMQECMALLSVSLKKHGINSFDHPNWQALLRLKSMVENSHE